jgi:hypothetical protein
VDGGRVVVVPVVVPVIVIVIVIDLCWPARRAVGGVGWFLAPETGRAGPD